MNLDNLPADLINYICELLNPEFTDNKENREEKTNQEEEKFKGLVSIIFLSQINRRLRQILNNQEYWKKLYIRDLSVIPPVKNIKKKYYKRFKEILNENIKDQVLRKECEKLVYRLDKDIITDGLLFDFMEDCGTLKEIIYLRNIILDNIYENNYDPKEFNNNFVEKMIETGNINLLKWIEQNCFVELNINYKSLIEIAILNYEFEILEYLEQKQPLTPDLLTYAVKSELEMVKCLIRQFTYTRSDIDKGICETSSFEIIEYLWHLSSEDPDILRPFISDFVDSYSDCIDIRVIEFLISVGYTQNIGEPLLLKACRTGNLKVVKLLIESGTSPDSDSSGDNSPLCIAAENGCNEILEYLLRKGANLNKLNNISMIHIKENYPHTYKLVLKLKREQKAREPKKEKRNYTPPKSNLCKAKTQRGDNCKKAASHGNYCYQHMKKFQEN